jgi:hypothetical protein
MNPPQIAVSVLHKEPSLGTASCDLTRNCRRRPRPNWYQWIPGHMTDTEIASQSTQASRDEISWSDAELVLIRLIFDRAAGRDESKSGAALLASNGNTQGAN